MDMMQRQKYYWKTKDSLKYSLKVTSAVYRNTQFSHGIHCSQRSGIDLSLNKLNIYMYICRNLSCGTYVHVLLTHLDSYKDITRLERSGGRTEKKCSQCPQK